MAVNFLRLSSGRTGFQPVLPLISGSFAIEYLTGVLYRSFPAEVPFEAV
jgi:hypothetical protein